MEGCFKQIKAVSACLVLLLVSACLPEDSTAVSNSEQQELPASIARSAQALAQNEANLFINFSRSLTTQIATSNAFQDGTITVGELSFATMGLQGMPEHARAAYCEETAADGTITPRIVTWMLTLDMNDGQARQTDNATMNEMVVHALRKQTGVNTGRASGSAVDMADGNPMQAISFDLKACGNPNIPANAPVLVSDSLSTLAGVGGAGNSSYEYETQACPEGQVGSITVRRAVEYTNVTAEDGTPARIPNVVGQWEPFQENCMEIINQLDTGQVAIEIYANQSPGQVADLEITDILASLGATECLGVEEGLDEERDTEDLIDCEVVRTGQREDLENPDGSDLEVTDEIMDRETIVHDCPVGATDPIAGYVQGYAGLVNVSSGWQGTMSFARHYLNVMNMANEEEEQTDSTFRKQWQGEDLLCTRDETLNIECATAYPQYDNPPYIPVETQGYNFARENRIEGWQDEENFVPNTSLPNDQGWQTAGGNCSWYERIEFDNVPNGYTPTAAGGGIYQRLISAAALDVTPTEGDWTGVTPSVGTRVEVNTLACPSGFTGSITETTTYRSEADFPWSTPVISSAVETDNNCVCSAEIEVRQTATTCSSGTAGTITEERQRSCPSGDWGDWQEAASTCTAPASNEPGCGPASVMVFSSFPTTGLCSTGTAENRDQETFSDGRIIYYWNCREADGTVNDGCSADHDSNADTLSNERLRGCGPAADMEFSTTPTSGLCDSGNAEGMRLDFYTNEIGQTSETYHWYCRSADGTTDARCSANRDSRAQSGDIPVQSAPICGTNVNTCVVGVMQDSWDTDRYWWECRVGGGTNACADDPNCSHCSAPIAAPANVTVGCAAQTLTAGACQYNFGAGLQGESQTVLSNTSDYVGEMYAQCDGGNWSAVTSSCEEIDIKDGACPSQLLSWGAGCQGIIGERETGANQGVRSSTFGGSANYRCVGETWQFLYGECSTLVFGCGPAGDMVFSSTPTSMLCNLSTDSDMRRNNSGTYLWECTGADGISMTCSAESTEIYNASCGNYHNTVNTSDRLTSQVRMCRTGSPRGTETQQADGSWRWTCFGNNGGTNVDCRTLP